MACSSGGTVLGMLSSFSFQGAKLKIEEPVNSINTAAKHPLGFQDVAAITRYCSYHAMYCILYVYVYMSVNSRGQVTKHGGPKELQTQYTTINKPKSEFSHTT